jgi:ATP-dependent helicase/nuclease subunit B
MLIGMVAIEFLGWDRPFLGAAVEWLMARRREELPRLLVVVPTAQCARRLREALAEAGGSILTPRFSTPGGLLQMADAGIAADWVERLAWAEVLEEVPDWSEFEGAFPKPPGEGRGWGGRLAMEMVRLRRSLQEGGLTLGAASRLLAESPEAERWEALGSLELRVEAWLAKWNLRSRSEALAAGLALPEGIAGVVLAGVSELAPVLQRALLAAAGTLEVTALVGAPADEADGFSALGLPLEIWASRQLPWPEGPGRVEVLADPRQQAAEALRAVAEAGTPAGNLALGTADAEVGEELARTFSREGWEAYHPGAAAPPAGLWRWFRVWSEWLAAPRLSLLADLLTLPETGPLVEFRRAIKARLLAEMRDDWMVATADELERLIELEPRWQPGAADTETQRVAKESRKSAALEVLRAARSLEAWRGELLRGDFVAPLKRLLGQLSRANDAAAEAALAMTGWLEDAEAVLAEVPRSPAFWIEIMLSEVSQPPPPPPDGRVIDVQGWLELYHEPGSHLVLCGMNEGKVPARMSGEPWLSEASRALLGLTGQSQRAARDAFLFKSMTEARRIHGRVDLFCGKTGLGGDTLLPSRLLLAGARDELPLRVKRLFREIAPPDADTRWESDWKWQVPARQPRQRVSVTSLVDYLACPFRFYLKHVVGLRTSSPGRREWNHRDFGNIGHEVLERWGRDTEARDFSKSEAIQAWVSAELDRVVAERFGARPPLAVRIQAEALRQRLGWFARHQACERADGWEIIDVERKIEIPVGNCVISGKIDRIERHPDGRMRVLDYKTGDVKGAEEAHRKVIKPSTVIPPHLAGEGCPAIHQAISKGNSCDFMWLNLQLPLYAAALMESGHAVVSPGYFRLPAKEANAGILEWEQFDPAAVDCAKTCADWIVSRITGAVFWPPAEKVTYDDYRELAPVGDFLESFEEPATALEPALPAIAAPLP